MGSSGRGRALTRVSRGVGLGWCGWVRGLSEKRAPEVGGNKGGGTVVISYPWFPGR